jgi:hypothetical protein
MIRCFGLLDALDLELVAKHMIYWQHANDPFQLFYKSSLSC